MAHSFIKLCKPLYHDKAVIDEGALSSKRHPSTGLRHTWQRPWLGEWTVDKIPSSHPHKSGTCVQVPACEERPDITGDGKKLLTKCSQATFCDDEERM